ncbi:MAG: hypothetical protein ACNYPE_11625 [Candidatus Azotimanducaceae bacterium WSBS_2022_MAG_OTU7]
MAEESRVSDILNEDVDFIAIHQNTQKIIVNKNPIIYGNAN